MLIKGDKGFIAWVHGKKSESKTLKHNNSSGNLNHLFAAVTTL